MLTYRTCMFFELIWMYCFYRYQCEKCDYYSLNRTQFRRHVAMHDGKFVRSLSDSNSVNFIANFMLAFLPSNLKENIYYFITYLRVYFFFLNFFLHKFTCTCCIIIFLINRKRECIQVY